jgi:hypothetical protein
MASTLTTSPAAEIRSESRELIAPEAGEAGSELLLGVSSGSMAIHRESMFYETGPKCETGKLPTLTDLPRQRQPETAAELAAGATPTEVWHFSCFLNIGPADGGMICPA